MNKKSRTPRFVYTLHYFNPRLKGGVWVTGYGYSSKGPADWGASDLKRRGCICITIRKYKLEKVTKA